MSVIIAKTSHRTRRVGDLLQRELSQLLQCEIADPRLQGLAISYVRLSKDLGHANIGVTQLNRSLSELEVVKILGKASVRLRYLLASKLQLRMIPVLHFQYDTFVLESARLHTQIDQVIAKDKLASNESAT